MQFVLAVEKLLCTCHDNTNYSTVRFTERTQNNVQASLYAPQYYLPSRVLKAVIFLGAAQHIFSASAARATSNKAS